MNLATRNFSIFSWLCMVRCRSSNCCLLQVASMSAALKRKRKRKKKRNKKRKRRKKRKVSLISRYSSLSSFFCFVIPYYIGHLPRLLHNWVVDVTRMELLQLLNHHGTLLIFHTTNTYYAVTFLFCLAKREKARDRQTGEQIPFFSRDTACAM